MCNQPIYSTMAQQGFLVNNADRSFRGLHLSFKYGDNIIIKITKGIVGVKAKQLPPKYE
jgi:hypothetical protein